MKVLYILLLLLPFSSFGQELKANLTARPSEVSVGEAFQLIVSSNAEGSVDLNLPSGVELIAQNTSVSSSSSMIVIINGKMQQNSSEKTMQYTFTCRASKKGLVNFAHVTFKGHGKTVNLNAVSITVTDAPVVSNSLKSNLNNNFFGIIHTNRDKVYVGEPVFVYSKVYARARITDIADFQPMKIDGTVHKTDLFNNKKNLEARNEQIQGKTFQTIQISEDVLIPQEAGTITCEPFDIKIGYQGNFFFSNYTTIHSGKASIKVLPLPANAPASFQGGVGKFAVTTSVSKTHLKEGGVFNYTIKISGSGNLHLLSAPEIQLPDEFELYGDPKIINHVTIGRSGGEGSIEYEYTIQAQEEGNFELPAFDFAYFDPQKEKYIEIPARAIAIQVAHDEHYEATASSERRDVTLKNNGIRYIVQQNDAFSVHFWWESAFFWLLVLLPFIVGIPLGLYLKKRSENAVEISARQQQKNAGKAAHKRLQKATEFLTNGDKKAFNSELLNVFTQFLAQKLKCPVAEVTREKIKQELNAKGASTHELEELLNVWSELEFVRYGMVDDANSHSLLAKVGSIIEKMDKV